MKRLKKHPEIGVFHAVSGQSINPEKEEHAALLLSVSQALAEKEECIKSYQNRAFSVKPSNHEAEKTQNNNPIDSLPNELQEKPKKPRALTKKDRRKMREDGMKKILEKRREFALRIDRDISNMNKYTLPSDSNSQEQSKKRKRELKKEVADLPEVTENPPIRPIAVGQSAIHPLDMIHRKMRCKGLVSNRKPIFNKRSHRSIRFKWSWVPYYRNHITTLR